MLVAHGANVNAQSFDGTTPLIAATALGDDDDDDGQAAKWLLAHGASTQVRDGSGVSPLHLAAERGFKDLVDSMVGVEILGVLVVCILVDSMVRKKIFPHRDLCCDVVKKFLIFSSAPLHFQLANFSWPIFLSLAASPGR